jgi:hypothetical protein
MFKGLNARRLYKSFGVKGLISPCHFFILGLSIHASDENHVRISHTYQTSRYTLPAKNPLWFEDNKLWTSSLSDLPSWCRSDQPHFSIAILQLNCILVGTTLINSIAYTSYVGRNTSVGIATRYWLDGPGIKSQRGEFIRISLDWP